MIQRKIIFTTLLILSIAPYSTIRPMNVAKKVFAPKNIKNGIEGLTTLGYGAILSIFCYGQHLNNKFQLQAMPPADIEVDTFVRNELKHLGYSPALVEQLKIVTPPDHKVEFTGLGFNKAMYVPLTKEMLNSAYSKDISALEQNAKKYLDSIDTQGADITIKEALKICSTVVGITAHENSLHTFKGIIAHEAGHVYGENYLLNTLIIPLLHLGSFYAVKKIGNASIARLCNPLQARHIIVPLLQGITTIPLLAINLPIARNLWYNYKKYNEYSADTQAINTIQQPEALHAMANLFEKTQFLADNKYAQLDQLHPSPASRARRFKEAAEKLEAKHTKIV